MSIDDDLRVLLRSPALALEPPSGLSADVRRRARRHRARTRVAAGGTTAALVVVGVLVLPSVRTAVDDLREGRNQPAGIRTDPRFPAATTDVVTLQRINGAEILTWFEGSRWCTVTSRVTQKESCVGPVDSAHRGFSWVQAAGSPSLTVDDQHVVAGIVPPDASRVIVHMRDGREFEAVIATGNRFPAPVWSTLVDDSTGVVSHYAAFDRLGKEIARRNA
ncbi:MAG: hypothetical protein JJD92_06565 [Frankiaceae bacterium]|nr:hypothetical protein [Frankiaceae bacterium]